MLQEQNKCFCILMETEWLHSLLSLQVCTKWDGHEIIDSELI